LHPDTHTHPHPAGDPHAPLPATPRPLRVGIGGPVGSGKTALVAARHALAAD
jgi:urease accessory protein